MKQLLLFIVVLFFKSSIMLSQNTGTISYSNFVLIPDNQNIHIHFVIDAGSTCNGISILHSTDNINFSVIHDFQGVCGSVSKSESYNFSHQSPIPNQTNYYKLFFGGLQYSHSNELFFRKLEPNILVLNSNPITNGLMEIEFKKDDSKKYLLSILNTMGVEVYNELNITSDKIYVNTTHFSNGKYLLYLKDDEGYFIRNTCLILN